MLDYDSMDSKTRTVVGHNDLVLHFHDHFRSLRGRQFRGLIGLYADVRDMLRPVAASSMSRTASSDGQLSSKLRNLIGAYAAAYESSGSSTDVSALAASIKVEMDKVHKDTLIDSDNFEGDIRLAASSIMQRAKRLAAQYRAYDINVAGVGYLGLSYLFSHLLSDHDISSASGDSLTGVISFTNGQPGDAQKLVSSMGNRSIGPLVVVDTTSVKGNPAYVLMDISMGSKISISPELVTRLNGLLHEQTPTTGSVEVRSADDSEFLRRVVYYNNEIELPAIPAKIEPNSELAEALDFIREDIQKGGTFYTIGKLGTGGSVGGVSLEINDVLHMQVAQRSQAKKLNALSTSVHVNLLKSAPKGTHVPLEKVLERISRNAIDYMDQHSGIDKSEDVMSNSKEDVVNNSEGASLSYDNKAETYRIDNTRSHGEHVIPGLDSIRHITNVAESAVGIDAILKGIEDGGDDNDVYAELRKAYQPDFGKGLSDEELRSAIEQWQDDVADVRERVVNECNATIKGATRETRNSDEVNKAKNLLKVLNSDEFDAVVNALVGNKVYGGKSRLKDIERALNQAYAMDSSHAGDIESSVGKGLRKKLLSGLSSSIDWDDAPGSIANNIKSVIDSANFMESLTHNKNVIEYATLNRLSGDESTSFLKRGYLGSLSKVIADNIENGDYGDSHESFHKDLRDSLYTSISMTVSSAIKDASSNAGIDISDADSRLIADTVLRSIHDFDGAGITKSENGAIIDGLHNYLVSAYTNMLKNAKDSGADTSDSDSVSGIISSDDRSADKIHQYASDKLGVAVSDATQSFSSKEQLRQAIENYLGSPEGSTLVDDLHEKFSEAVKFLNSMHSRYVKDTGDDRLLNNDGTFHSPGRGHGWEILVANNVIKRSESGTSPVNNRTSLCLDVFHAKPVITAILAELEDTGGADDSLPGNASAKILSSIVTNRRISNDYSSARSVALANAIKRHVFKGCSDVVGYAAEHMPKDEYEAFVKALGDGVKNTEKAIGDGSSGKYILDLVRAALNSNRGNANIAISDQMRIELGDGIVQMAQEAATENDDHKFIRDDGSLDVGSFVKYEMQNKRKGSWVDNLQRKLTIGSGIRNSGDISKALHNMISVAISNRGGSSVGDAVFSESVISEVLAKVWNLSIPTKDRVAVLKGMWSEIKPNEEYFYKPDGADTQKAKNAADTIIAGIISQVHTSIESLVMSSADDVFDAFRDNMQSFSDKLGAALSNVTDGNGNKLMDSLDSLDDCISYAGSFISKSNDASKKKILAAAHNSGYTESGLTDFVGRCIYAYKNGTDVEPPADLSVSENFVRHRDKVSEVLHKELPSLVAQDIALKKASNAGSADDRSIAKGNIENLAGKFRVVSAMNIDEADYKALQDSKSSTVPGKDPVTPSNSNNPHLPEKKTKKNPKKEDSDLIGKENTILRAGYLINILARSAVYAEHLVNIADDNADRESGSVENAAASDIESGALKISESQVRAFVSGLESGRASRRLKDELNHLDNTLNKLYAQIGTRASSDKDSMASDFFRHLEDNIVGNGDLKDVYYKFHGSQNVRNKLAVIDVNFASTLEALLHMASDLVVVVRDTGVPIEAARVLLSKSLDIVEKDPSIKSNVVKLFDEPESVSESVNAAVGTFSKNLEDSIRLVASTDSPAIDEATWHTDIEGRAKEMANNVVALIMAVRTAYRLLDGFVSYGNVDQKQFLRGVARILGNRDIRKKVDENSERMKAWETPDKKAEIAEAEAIAAEQEKPEARDLNDREKGLLKQLDAFHKDVVLSKHRKIKPDASIKEWLGAAQDVRSSFTSYTSDNRDAYGDASAGSINPVSISKLIKSAPSEVLAWALKKAESADVINGAKPSEDVSGVDSLILDYLESPNRKIGSDAAMKLVTDATNAAKAMKTPFAAYRAARSKHRSGKQEKTPEEETGGTEQ